MGKKGITMVEKSDRHHLNEVLKWTSTKKMGQTVACVSCWDALRKAQHYSWSSWLKCITWIQSYGNIRQNPTDSHSTIPLTCTLQNDNVMKYKERLRNYSRKLKGQDNKMQCMSSIGKLIAIKALIGRTVEITIWDIC